MIVGGGVADDADDAAAAVVVGNESLPLSLLFRRFASVGPQLVASSAVTLVFAVASVFGFFDLRGGFGSVLRSALVFTLVNFFAAAPLVDGMAMPLDAVGSYLMGCSGLTMTPIWAMWSVSGAGVVSIADASEVWPKVDVVDC